MVREKIKSGENIPCWNEYVDKYMTEVESHEKPDNLQRSPNEWQRREFTDHGNNDGKHKRKNMTDTQESNDTTNTTLLLQGLHKLGFGQIQDEHALLLQAFEIYGVVRVRIRALCAFLDFNLHEEARRCILETRGEIVVANTPLTLSWASDKHTQQDNNKRRRLDEAEVINSSSLHFCLPHELSDVLTVSENLRILAGQTLENALGDPDITSENEPGLQVKLGKPQDTENSGFLEFASHAAASMVLAALTDSTDGGQVLNYMPEALRKDTFLYWADEKRQENSHNNNNMIETASDIKFKPQYFPADACTEHLITSVHDQCYITMAKGPIHKEGHVLLVPATHSRKGTPSDLTALAEMEKMKEELRRYASITWDLGLFVFERAIQTEGKYNQYIQCVPVPKKSNSRKVQKTMITMGEAYGVTIREISHFDRLTASGKGFFYAEIPGKGNKFKRFLGNADENTFLPVQFGREILASTMNNPKLSHWKACVLSKEEETETGLKFKESFSKFLT